ncbi:MAG: ECF transporter S component [Aerococcus sp.]|nr:ECF transporter S component [Aerococcus sp.]
MSSNKVRKMVITALGGALAFVLMNFSFPIIPTVPFLKIDFSDVIILFVTFLSGLPSGIGVLVIRNLLHYLQTGGDMGYPIGDFASVLATLAYLLPVAWILKDHYAQQGTNFKKVLKTLKRPLLAYGIGTIALTIMMSVLNYFVITPFYLKVMNFDVGNLATYILTAVIPFNLAKGIIIGIVAHLLLSYCLPIVKRRLR